MLHLTAPKLGTVCSCGLPQTCSPPDSRRLAIHKRVQLQYILPAQRWHMQLGAVTKCEANCLANNYELLELNAYTLAGQM